MDGRMWPAARDLTDMRIISYILFLYEGKIRFLSRWLLTPHEECGEIAFGLNRSKSRGDYGHLKCWVLSHLCFNPIRYHIMGIYLIHQSS
jgi:hypothetical protein